MQKIISALFLISVVSLFAQNAPNFGKPLVPDEQTATKIAEAILFKMYGEKLITSEKPYQANLSDGKWYISGSLPASTGPLPIFGGTFYIVISEKDAQVLKIGHDE